MCTKFSLIGSTGWQMKNVIIAKINNDISFLLFHEIETLHITSGVIHVCFFVWVFEEVLSYLLGNGLLLFVCHLA